jgi:hypothetical protein
LQEIIAALISFFLIEPVRDRVAEHYAETGLSAQAAAEAASCFSEATPGILERAGNNPAGAASHAFGYWTGMSTIDGILSDVAPHCAVAVEKTRGSEPQA